MAEYKQLDINWSFNEKKKIDSVILTQEQLISISRYMTYAIDRTKKQLQRWENHPADMGQVQYIEKRKDLRAEINFFKEILELGKELKTQKTK